MNKLSTKGGGEAYIDPTRGSAYGMGNCLCKIQKRITSCIRQMSCSSTEYPCIIKSMYSILSLGQEDIKNYVQERMDDEDRMGRLSRVELFHLHVLIEQASHEIRQKRPEVSINNNDPLCYTEGRVN